MNDVDVTALYAESQRLKDEGKPEEAIAKLQECWRSMLGMC